VATQAERNAAIAAEASRQRNLERAQAAQAAAKTALETAQVGARGTTGQTIFEKALAGIPKGGDEGAARGLAAMSARYGLQGAALNAYTGENIGYNISEQTKAEQQELDTATGLVGQYGTPINIPTVTAAAGAGRNSAYDLLLSQFQLYGLGSLVEPLKALITDDTSAGELTILLRSTPEYQKRFAANKDRIAKGLTALNEKEYLGLEDQYQNIMRNYGLPATYYAKGDLGRQEGFEKLIANDVSATELEDRVMTAQSRVVNANPEVMQALKRFYPDITNGEILAYTLDPTKALTDIKRKVTAAEIGGAAIGAGLNTTQTSAEGLAAYGVTKGQAQQGYGAIAEFLPTGEKLSQIYQETPYTQTQAEQEIFNLANSAEAAKKRKRLSQLETASFGGSSGTGSGALSRDRAGNYQQYGAPGAGAY
jgi:hypothetical protein